MVLELIGPTGHVYAAYNPLPSGITAEVQTEPIMVPPRTLIRARVRYTADEMVKMIEEIKVGIRADLMQSNPGLNFDTSDVAEDTGRSEGSI